MGARTTKMIIANHIDNAHTHTHIERERRGGIHIARIQIARMHIKVTVKTCTNEEAAWRNRSNYRTDNVPRLATPGAAEKHTANHHSKSYSYGRPSYPPKTKVTIITRTQSIVTCAYTRTHIHAHTLSHTHTHIHTCTYTH